MKKIGKNRQRNQIASPREEKAGGIHSKEEKLENREDTKQKKRQRVSLPLKSWSINGELFAQPFCQ